MKTLRLMMMGFALVGLMTACGGAPQGEAVAVEEATVAEPTPVFEDDFESGESESWAEDEKAQPEEGQAPTEVEDKG